MDINITYTAKDGRRFNDPYECEKYEARLGTEAGTVARARIDLKALGEDYEPGHVEPKPESKFGHFETNPVTGETKFIRNKKE